MSSRVHAIAGSRAYGMTWRWCTWCSTGRRNRYPVIPASRTGQEQARLAGRRLRGLGISALYSSPMRRARETAEGVASVTGLTVEFDARLRERLNWDGSVPFDVFLDLWARTMRDRDWVPADGE